MRNRLYFVYFRLWGTRSGEVDKLTTAPWANAIRLLLGICEQERNDSVTDIRSSVYGRFACVEEPVSALNYALQVRETCVGRGIDLSVGIAAGRPVQVSDLSVPGNNILSTALNGAARLASMDDGKGRIAVHRDSVTAIVNWDETYQLADFLTEDVCPVKGANLPYRFHIDTRTTRVPIAEGITVNQDSPEEVHVMVYDVAGFSGLDTDQARRVVEDLTHEVDRVLKGKGCVQRMQSGELWYAPAGDGGALVLSCRVEDAGSIVFEIACSLRKACGGRLPIRIGLATGSVIVIEGMLPVGRGILASDAVFAIPDTGEMCAAAGFWEQLPAPAKKGWEIRNAEKDRDALLLFDGVIPDDAVLRVGDTENAIVEKENAFPRVERELVDILSHHPALKEKLERLLLEEDTGVQRDAGDWDIVKEARRRGASEVLLDIANGLDSLEPSLNAHPLRRVVSALAVFAVADSWVIKHRSYIREGPVTVPAELRPFSSETIVGALFDILCQFGGVYRDGEPPTGEGIISLTMDIPPKEVSNEAFKLDVLKNVLSEVGFDVSAVTSLAEVKGKLADLKKALYGYRRLKKPRYTILSEQAGEIDRILTAYHLHDVLRMRRDSNVDSVVRDAGTMWVALVEIIAKLDAFGESASP